MIDPALPALLEDFIRQSTGNDFHLDQLAPVSGGDINTCLRASDGSAHYFVKLRAASDIAMFRTEADGLQAMSACRSLRVPRVLGVDVLGGHAILLLEWIDLRPLREPADAERAAHALAALHRIQHERFGWPSDNFIGSTPQTNTWSDNWPQFFSRMRLAPQLERAARQGFRGRLQEAGERLRERLPALFLDYHPSPSLLHGDLWSGNIGVAVDGTPVLYDPACHFGDREADLAMTELFGGFPPRFYAASREAWPPAAGYEARKTLYNLYHVLNHLNLFGRGYLAQAERMSGALAAELGR